MKKGISIIGIIVFIGLVALIVWSLNFIINKDSYVDRTSIVSTTSNKTDSEALETSIATTTTTTTTTTLLQTTPIATSTPATKPATNYSDLTVTFTDKGFSPTTLTIKKGQTVTFVNNSSDKMMVASNPFPSSSDYPAFKEQTGAAVGASWSFTFDKTGVWFYHNHYHPAQGAKIIVNAK